MNYKEYQEFEKKNDGAICSFFFLRELYKLFSQRHFKRVLEIGVGMGTMPHFLENSGFAEWVGTEALDFCIKALKVNAPFVSHHNDMSSVGGTFDLVIVDGRDKNLDKISLFIRERGVILVEGNRGEQVEQIKANLSLSSRSYITYRKRPFVVKRSPGYTIFILEPNMKEYLWSLIAKPLYKIQTHISHRLRRSENFFISK